MESLHFHQMRLYHGHFFVKKTDSDRFRTRCKLHVWKKKKKTDHLFHSPLCIKREIVLIRKKGNMLQRWNVIERFESGTFTSWRMSRHVPAVSPRLLSPYPAEPNFPFFLSRAWLNFFSRLTFLLFLYRSSRRGRLYTENISGNVSNVKAQGWGNFLSMGKLCARQNFLSILLTKKYRTQALNTCWEKSSIITVAWMFSFFFFLTSWIFISFSHRWCKNFKQERGEIQEEEICKGFLNRYPI